VEEEDINLRVVRNQRARKGVETGIFFKGTPSVTHFLQKSPIS
jgi:hypothetical protein